MRDQQQVTTEVEVETHPLVVRMHPVIDLTDDQFFEFCQINRDLRIEIDVVFDKSKAKLHVL